MLEAKTYTGIDNLPEQYSRLFEEAGQDSVFLSLPWFRNLERTVLGVNEVVQVVGVEKRASSSVALGALVLKVNRRSNRFLSPANHRQPDKLLYLVFRPGLGPALERS